jgi:DNA polymerase-1
MLADAFRLFMEGAEVLSEIEQTGIRIDLCYCRKIRKKLLRKVEEIREGILASKEGRIWRRLYGDATKLNSPDQLRRVLFDHLGAKAECRTATGKMATNVEALSRIDNPLVKHLLEMRKLQKVVSTYLDGLVRYTDANGILHPSYNLHTVRTFRSSSSNPNFQNIPIRDAMEAEYIRTAFIPREGRQLVEADFKGVEVRVAACYHKDPTMLKYLRENYDMHREMAAECYDCDPKLVSDTMRYVGKNRFVFPEFYGSFFKQVAPALWTAVGDLKLELKDGTSLFEHLQGRGLHTYLDFEEHIEKVENRFWHKRFPVYEEWRKRCVEKYVERGWLCMKTGFRCSGELRRNEIVNYPIQGAAFHCLLWTLIRLHRWLVKGKFKSFVIGQIHDSIILDLVPDEREEVLDKLRRLVSVSLPKHWPWLIVPMEVEIVLCPVNGSWFQKGKG